MTLVCPHGMRPNYVDTNGTIYVTCVHYDTKDNKLLLALCLSLPLFIVVCVIIFAIYNIYTRKKVIDKVPNETVNAHIIHVHQLRRWESFIGGSGFIRRIAQVLEAEAVIPKEVDDYIKEEDPIGWEKMQDTSFDFIQKAAWAIHFLFKKEAETKCTDVNTEITKWRDTLTTKCGGEWAEHIMDKVAII